MTGLLVLLTALMVVVDLERNTARAATEVYRAELAVESGLEEAKSSLAFLGSSDSFVIAELPMAVAFDDDDDGSIDAYEDDTIDPDAGESGRPYLFGIQGERQGSSVSYNLIPLFTTNDPPPAVQMRSTGFLDWPDDPGLTEETERGLDAQIALRAVPHKQAPVTNWRIVENAEGEPVARYSYWVEDMQGYIDPALSPGNSLGRTNELWQRGSSSAWSSAYRSAVTTYQDQGGGGEETLVPLWPAPGINPGAQVSALVTSATNPILNQAGLYTLPFSSQPGTGEMISGREDSTSFDDEVRAVRTVAPTGRSLMTLLGVEGPLERQVDGPDRGRLVQENKPYLRGRALEENVTRGNRAWRERALIPFTPGISPSVMGETKLNLNAQLSANRETAIGRMTDLINEALPDFAAERQGGFPEDYLATLAANALDYADDDDDISRSEGLYRGVENAPLVSEFLRTTTFSWESVPDLPDTDFTNALLAGESNPFIRKNGRLYLGLTVRVYAELWNPTNHGVAGSYRVSYENERMLAEGFMPETSFADQVILENNLLGAGAARADEPFPEGVSGSYHDLTQLDDDKWYFPSKEISLLPNEYQLVYVGSVRYLFDVGPDDYFASSRVELLDGIDQSSFRLRWIGESGVAVLSDWARGGIEVSELSDIEVQSGQNRTFSHVSANSYRELYGSFANGMGDLRTNYYADMPLTDSRYPGNYSPNRRNVRYETIYSNDSDLVYGRTIPSEWPDGGHDSTFDFSSFHDLNSTNSTRQYLPDDQVFQTKAPTEPMKAPVFLSNLGRFISETELGNVFDPLMWEGPGSGSASQWVEEISRSSRVKPSTTIGGGNTLRIGRPEHSRFYTPPTSPADRTDSSLCASHLLDLFHAGIPGGFILADRNSVRRLVEGHVNVNTASHDVLRTLVAGYLASDPLLARQSTSHDERSTLAPRVSLLEDEDRYGAPSKSIEADLVADAIIAGRPYMSRSELAQAVALDEASGDYEPVFGNPDLYPRGSTVQWTDRAAEEVFARLYNNTTVRSRNFRVHVIGQSLRRTPSGLYRAGSTKKKSYRVFVDSGTLGTTEIDSEDVVVEVINEINL
ncbi:MAG: hypothetical protein Q7Q71_01025 [Verrucomicrobiota bacterium JB023]|nr:hypothetical protein [Verrucomicrobiota bacterium JB023]